MNNSDNKCLVTIIIPTHNNLKMIRQVTEGIHANTSPPFDLIIVDNASNDQETLTYLDSVKESKLAKIVSMPENRYYWPAINTGISEANKDSCFFLALNDDIIIESQEWLPIIISKFEDDPKIGIVGDFHRYPDFEPLGGWIDGYCAMIRRELIDDIGLFNEKYPFHWGFVDFQLRAYKKSYAVNDLKESGDKKDHISRVVTHLRGQTLLQARTTMRSSDKRLLFGTPLTRARLLAKHGFYKSALNIASQFIKKSFRDFISSWNKKK